MRARIAHVVPTDRIAFYLLRARLLRLQRAGYEVCLICGRSAAPEQVSIETRPDVAGRVEISDAAPDGGASGARSYTEALRQCGLDVIHIPFAREIAPLTDLSCARALLGVLRHGDFDVVHSHNPKGGLLVPPVGQLVRHPVVVHTVHGFLFNEHTRGLRRVLAVGAEKWTAAWSDHLLFQSREDHAWATQHHLKPAPNLHLIGNERFDPFGYPGARVAKRRELGFEPGDLVVGMVGRLVREKGYVEFFEMAGRMAATHPQARFLVVGITEPDQSDAVDAAALIDLHGLAGRCVVLEQRWDMPELYLAMDVAVLPSHREGIPRALMEAAAMSIPVVATDIRGCREVVAEGETGFLFPLGDVASFAEAVSRLLGDPGERERMGGAGRQRILEGFTESATAARIEACYEQILGAQRAPPAQGAGRSESRWA